MATTLKRLQAIQAVCKAGLQTSVKSGKQAASLLTDDFISKCVALLLPSFRLLAFFPSLLSLLPLGNMLFPPSYLLIVLSSPPHRKLADSPVGNEMSLPWEIIWFSPLEKCDIPPSYCPFLGKLPLGKTAGNLVPLP